MKQTRKRHKLPDKHTVIRNAFLKKKTRRGQVGGAWSTKDLLLATIKYGSTQNIDININDSTTQAQSGQTVSNNQNQSQTLINGVYVKQILTNTSTNKIGDFISEVIGNTNATPTIKFATGIDNKKIEFTVYSNVLYNVLVSSKQWVPEFEKISVDDKPDLVSLRSSIVLYLYKTSELQKPTKIDIDPKILETDSTFFKTQNTTYQETFKSLLTAIRANKFEEASVKSSELAKATATTTLKDVITFFGQLSQILTLIKNIFPLQQNDKILGEFKKKYVTDKIKTLEKAVSISTILNTPINLLNLANGLTADVKANTSGVDTTHNAKVDEILSIMYGSVNTKSLPTAAPPTRALPTANQKKQQLSIVLPFFLQIYESLYIDANYNGKTKIKRHTEIPNHAILEFVVQEIRKIENQHPHPELFESIFYFWNIFNLPTALAILAAYLSEVPTGEDTKDVPGRIATIVEKQLGNASTFQEWDTSITKPHDYRVYTKTYGQTFNPYKYADSTLIALASNPFSPYNPYISRRDMDIIVNEETGAFENINSTTSQPTML